MNINELQTIEDTVRDLLIKYEKTRSDDRLLFLKYLIEIGYDTDKSVADFLLDVKAPNIETVSRARRKVQENHPELQADEKTRAKRKEKEAVFTSYAWE